MPTAVRSHAKINLGLAIGAPRVDGFHALTTVYQTLELHDVLTVTARPAGATAIRLTSNDSRVPTDSRNTAWKMVSLVLGELGRAANVEIHIEKRLPVQGGLGAGSANAVAALVGLEAELGIGPGAAWPARRLEMAAQVGSDVPLFLIGGTVLGLDRGQDVYPLPDLDPAWCVVALPETGVSTPQAFRDWDALCAAEGLTAEASEDRLKQLSRAYASAFAEGITQGGQQTGSSGVILRTDSDRDDLAGPHGSALVRTGIMSWIQNDFERVVFVQQPSLREIKRILAADGTPEAALHASLSGSGSALFGLYRTREDAEAACARLRAAGVQQQLTRTLPRAAYWQQMLS
ncbi:MAG TPA: 4-(cytidine 5'-diphospho)-2-C-methyl-D-erythritol kinase [Terracidiphilus sp.]|jgi:4-diphosphocytidyl-2-C-methyl-D-erythritol kinase|nr:4-(cytidine 5'-diphospho)-2-C-methyl-D-erythritol kinase [Terracidiphilus sp.]